MIQLFTDFGLLGPYVGEMHAAIHRNAHANGIPVVDLMHDAPKYDPRAAAYLLAALAIQMRPGDICVGVVDPGVGTDRAPIILQADNRYFIGPDNGLFGIVARRFKPTEVFRITWQPDWLSASFHGRDLFAPVAARLANILAGIPDGTDWVGILAEPCVPSSHSGDWPDDLDEVIYIDGFGNCVTGRRAETMQPGERVGINGQELPAARTFGEVRPGNGFWYENSMGLVEIAVNQGNAKALYGVEIGSKIRRV